MRRELPILFNTEKLWAKIGVEKINKEVITSYGKIKNLFESGRKL